MSTTTQVYDYSQPDNANTVVNKHEFSYNAIASATVAGYMVTVYKQKNEFGNPKLIVEGLDYMPEIIEKTEYANNDYKPKDTGYCDFCERLTLKELKAFVVGEKHISNRRQLLCLAFAYGVITASCNIYMKS